MICAECPCCGARSLLDPASAMPGRREERASLPESRASGPAASADETRLRCDVCGSKRARLIRFDSVLEALAFVAGRRIT